MKRKSRKRTQIIRILAMLLCVSLMVQDVPLNALAAESVSGQGEELHTEEYSTEQSVKSKEDTSVEQAEETASEKLKEEEQEDVRQELSDAMTQENEQETAKEEE